MSNKKYVQHYMRGGQIPVFAGGQHGEGLGAVLKSAGRFLLPIIAGSAAKFVSSTAKGLRQGRSFKDATKGAIGPTLTGAIDGTVTKIKRKNKKLKVGKYTRFTNQKGMGRRVYKKKTKTTGSKKINRKKHRVLKTNF